MAKIQKERQPFQTCLDQKYIVANTLVLCSLEKSEATYSSAVYIYLVNKGRRTVRRYLKFDHCQLRKRNQIMGVEVDLKNSKWGDERHLIKYQNAW